MPLVFVIDDDRTIHEMIKHSLGKVGINVELFFSSENGLQALEQQKPDVLLLDVMLPGLSGMEMLEHIQKVDRRLPVILITSSNDNDLAIKAMQLGAYDYVAKPLDLPQLNELVLQAIETNRLMNTPVALPVGEAESASSDQFVGRSPGMLEVFKAIGRVAAENLNVLIRGESGTGKELVARAIYQHSPRADDNFMAVNCAALSETLLESELFGYEKGAFTGANKQRIGKFEQCNGGTLFLDEVGDMSQLTQGKVLRLLQEQQFERVGGNDTVTTDVRIIAATNRNLEEMVEEGSFREDLFYRLNGMTITLPPLRERDGDISLLIEHFLMTACHEMNRTEIDGISQEALELFANYDWPGNVRELQSSVNQSILNCSGPIIVPAFLPEYLKNSGQTASRSLDQNDPHPAASDFSLELESDLKPFVDEQLLKQSKDIYSQTLKMMEQYLITRILEKTGGNQSKAAELLGITRGKLRDRIAQYGISLEKTVNLSKAKE